MFIIFIAKIVKKVRNKLHEAKEDFLITNYSETLLPWMRRFVGLWLRMGRWFILWNLVALPAAHVYATSYAYGIGYFWLIYAPICGLFFNLYHNDDGGEGFYFLNKGCLEPIIRRVRAFFDRF